MFNAAYYKNFAAVFAKVTPAFQEKSFTKEVTKGLADKALNERMRNTSIVLQKYLPENYRQAITIMKEAAPHLQKGYTALVLPDFVGLFGKHDIHFSLEALKFFTVFGSSEFAVREFFRMDPDTTIDYMEKWAADENHHVRRLASEGSRPRLPWSFRLDAVIKKPSLTSNILNRLKADDHIYVRKSVANHLNDISKDHPEFMLDLISAWDMTNMHTRWIVKHACRTLIKKGHAGSLKLFSFRHGVKASVNKLRVQPYRLRLGETLEFQFEVEHQEKTTEKLVIDYAIIYSRPNGAKSRKVFKLKEIALESGQKVLITKKQVFRDFTTRTHYAGKHLLEIIVNGTVFAEKEFLVVIPAQA